MAASLWGKVRQFDAYPKTLEDFRVKTFGGAASKCLQRGTGHGVKCTVFAWILEHEWTRFVCNNRPYIAQRCHSGTYELSAFLER